jgi:hypothetical protein
LTLEDGHKLFPEGVCFSVIAFEQIWNEYALDQGAQRGAFLAVHDKKPPGTQWLKPPAAPKSGNWGVVDGFVISHIVETLLAYLLIESPEGPLPGVYSFYSTALSIGYQLAAKAQNLKVRLPGENGTVEELKGCALGRFEMTSAIEKRGDKRWYLPSIELKGRLGEAKGPTLETWRATMGMRQAFRQGLAWEPEASAIAGPPKPPAIDSGLEEPLAHRARSAIESGRYPRAVESPPPVTEYDGPDSEDSDSDPF